MEALNEPCNVSRDLFQTHRLVSSSSVDRRGTVAKVRLYSATEPRLPWRTPSPSLLLPPLPLPLPPPSRRCCPCAASRIPPAPIVPAALGSQARRSKSSRNAKVLAELRRWGTGGTGSGRGQRGKPGEPGQSVRGRSPGGQLRVREFGFSLLDPPLVAGLPHGVGAPAGAPGDEPGLEVADVTAWGWTLM